MKPSTILVASGAMLAAASPIAGGKRRIETKVIVVMETVTVTDWQPHASRTWEAPAWVPPTTTSTLASTSTTTVVYASPAAPSVETVSSAAPSVETKSSAAPAVAVKAPPSSAAEVATSTSAAQSSSGGNSYSGVAVDKHNAHRTNHSVNSVSYNDNYASSAAQLAATCNFHHDTTFGGGGYGQNIAAWGSSGDVKSIDPSLALGSAIDDMWYNGELPLYPSSNYGNSNPDMSGFEGWGHFSAMVWKKTEQIGCATQYCAPGTMYGNMGAYFTVCNYYPPGNVIGDFANNVFPSLGHATEVTNI